MYYRGTIIYQKEMNETKKKYSEFKKGQLNYFQQCNFISWSCHMPYLCQPKNLDGATPTRNNLMDMEYRKNKTLIFNHF